MSQRKDRERASTGAGTLSSSPVPATIKVPGPRAAKRFLEFFAANIRNRNTREAYYRALVDFFAWCGDRGFGLLEIEPILVAAYVEYLGTIYSVRGPSYLVHRGKTPVEEAGSAGST